MPGPAGSERRTGTQRHPAEFQKERGRSGERGDQATRVRRLGRVVQAERPAVQPDQVRALRRAVSDARQVAVQQVGEQASVVVQPGQQRIEPGPPSRSAALWAITPRWLAP